MTILNTNTTENSNVVDIDKRIIKQDYRNYDLVARFWQGGYRGKIWKNNKSVDQIDGSSIEEILQSMRSMVDKLVDEKLQIRQQTAPTAEEIEQALFAIEDKISWPQRTMLMRQAQTQDGSISVQDAQKTAGFSSTTEVLLSYAEIAKRLSDELGYWPQTAPGQDPALSILLAESPDQGATMVLTTDAVAAIGRLKWAKSASA